MQSPKYLPKKQTVKAKFDGDVATSNNMPRSTRGSSSPAMSQTMEWHEGSHPSTIPDKRAQLGIAPAPGTPRSDVKHGDITVCEDPRYEAFFQGGPRRGERGGHAKGGGKGRGRGESFQNEDYDADCDARSGEMITPTNGNPDHHGHPNHHEEHGDDQVGSITEDEMLEDEEICFTDADDDQSYSKRESLSQMQGGGRGGGDRNIGTPANVRRSQNTPYGLDPLDTVNLEDEENVHWNSIQRKVLKSPAVIEMRENEMFAKAAGLRYHKQKGDILSVVEENVPQDKVFDPSVGPKISPRHQCRENSAGSVGDFFTTLIGRRSNDADDVYDLDDHPHLQDDYRDEHGNVLPPNATFLRGSAADGNGNEDDLAKLRLLAGQLSADWRTKEFFAPALARRLRDFQFAQEKRRKRYGNERPWGILGLYDHLASVRMDVEWAEDAAWRRANGEPYCPWADFETYKNSGFNRPFFTYFILVVCTGVLVASTGLNDWSVEPFDTNPMIGPSRETLILMGAKDTNLIVNGNESWRLVSPMVLHAGLIHYFLNMLALWFIGSAVEQSHGFIPTLILFIIPAIGGTVLSAIFLPGYISVGASGGIFGLIGACLADIVMNWGLLFSDLVNEGDNKKRHVFVLVFLFMDIVLNCLLGVTPFVDNFTHLGGMVFGFLCGLSTMERIASDFFGVEERRCWSITKNIIARFFGIIISIVCIMAATIILLEGDGITSPCKMCNTLSCVPFPPWEGHENKWWHCDDCGDVTADARIDQKSGSFNQLSLDCPDGSKTVFDLDVPQSDKTWLEANLPKFCRQHCENTFGT